MQLKEGREATLDPFPLTIPMILEPWVLVILRILTQRGGGAQKSNPYKKSKNPRTLSTEVRASYMSLGLPRIKR